MSDLLLRAPIVLPDVVVEADREPTPPDPGAARAGALLLLAVGAIVAVAAALSR